MGGSRGNADIGQAVTIGNGGALTLDHKIITSADMTKVTGFFDDLQGICPENPVTVCCVECADTAPAQAKLHVSLIHLFILLCKQRKPAGKLCAVTGWLVNYRVSGQIPKPFLVTASAL